MNEHTDATSIFAPLWRRKWLILAVGVIVAAASYLYYKRERPEFQAATQIYLGAGSEEQAAGEKANSKTQGGVIANQAAIINSIVAEGVRKRLHAEHKRTLVRGSKIKAKAVEKSQFITVTTQAHTARGAALLANLTAQAYISRQRATHQRVTERQINITRRQLRRIEAGSSAKASTKSVGKSTAKGKEAEEKEKAALSSPLNTGNVLQAANLSSKINQLEASLAQTGAQQVKPAHAATAIKLSPKPRKNAIFGFVIGLVLAAIAAYVLSRLDRRLRAIGAIESVTQAQVIAALPKVRQPIVRREGRPTPSRFLVEPLRRLHTAIELAGSSEPGHNNSGHAEPQRKRGRVILFTSPDQADGKSTIVADLALVQREANARVAIVEADFRRPVQAKLLGIDGSHGLADVLEGGLNVEEAMQRVMPSVDPAGPAAAMSGAAVATAVQSPPAGSLFLLAGSTQIANPPALLARDGMSDLLRSLPEEFDYVLVDGPSPLEVSDVLPLLDDVDGVVVVARLGHTRELSAQRLANLLAQSSPAPVLGAIANCVSSGESARYGFSSSRGASPARLIGR